MGWQEHQAVLVGHKDRSTRMSMCWSTPSPEPAGRWITGFEKRRAQEWALRMSTRAYLIFCEERLKP